MKELRHIWSFGFETEEKAKEWIMRNVADNQYYHIQYILAEHKHFVSVFEEKWGVQNGKYEQ